MQAEQAYKNACGSVGTYLPIQEKCFKYLESSCKRKELWCVAFRNEGGEEKSELRPGFGHSRVHSRLSGADFGSDEEDADMGCDYQQMKFKLNRFQGK
ncbi:hypothetical protein AVEN_105551-1 [Araneus ventricosus]|uniref:Uncharacterized protein n=1 Tax=Araneus ventricosus TaxID=182803 RepID=A0A4Y2GSN0_ARAVE|nr:hypothetical protein AVEN_105551-1 [Araneus ventricosus]